MSKDEQAIESIDLESLVNHHDQVEAGTSLEQVQHVFRSSKVEYLAVVRSGRAIGLCSRGRVGFVMGSRFGFAIYGMDGVESVMVDRPLFVIKGSPIREVLDRALRRHGDDFMEDVILVGEEQRLLGLIRVEVLADLQSRLVSEQVTELQRHHRTLRQQNIELFHASNAARQSHGLYLGLFASHWLGVALLDEKGNIHEQNERLSELLGLVGTGVAVGSLSGWIVEGERAAFVALLESHVKGRSAPANQEFTFNIPKRGVRIVRCSMGWIKETGQICACLDDVTEQRMLEQNVLRQEKQTLLDTLIGGIAHELNNKLAPIMGFAELLKSESDVESSEYFSLIIKSVREAARIIQQLLELAKPVSQTVQIVDLRTIAQETLTILKFQLQESGCAVQAIIPGSPVLVKGDAGQLKQVALNLGINALHAMEHRRNPMLTFEIRADAQEAEFVVSDNGCGIEKQNLPRIFDPFFTTKGPEKGTGLGLSVCFGIVRQLGGEISVRSELGSGSTFTVRLPLESEPLVAADNDIQGVESPFAYVQSGVRVLIVEDELVVRRLLQEILRTQFRCRVELACNGIEALEAMKRESFSLILSDIRMPAMNGKEFYERVREYYPELANRFIFITGHTGDRSLAAEIRKWKVPIVAKPFTVSRLAEVCVPILQNPVLKIG